MLKVDDLEDNIVSFKYGSHQQCSYLDYAEPRDLKTHAVRTAHIAPTKDSSMIPDITEPDHTFDNPLLSLMMNSSPLKMM